METEPQLYLIAHKVRGELAFDIAHQLTIGDEEGWIIPTSGHRAHPYWWLPLETLHEEGSPYSVVDTFNAYYFDPDVVPDHYETVADKGRGLVTGLSALLGIKRPTITRRL